MESAIGIFAFVLFLVGIVWAIHFGNGLGKDIARYQISKLERQYDLEARIRKLEEKEY